MAKTQEQIQAEAIKVLEKLAGDTFGDDDITFEGQRFVLPEHSNLRDAARFINKKADEAEEYTTFHRQYNFVPWDVAFCMVRAFKRLFGSISHTGTWLSPPTLIEVPDGPNSTVQIPQGMFSIPHLPSVTFTIGANRDPEWGLVGVVSAEGPKHMGKAINAVFNIIGEELATASMYRGKAIVYGDTPKFIDVNKIDPSRIIYSREVQDALDTHVMARLDHPEALADLGIPFRSKILLEGEFGVGKTEALNLTAKRAAAQEITFILVPKDQQHDLIQAMNYARAYAPAVVAFEDVDTVAGSENESERVSAILDAFDGGQSKLNQVMVLATTNYVETLHKGMVRPGRIDAIINLTAPDAAGIQAMIEVNIPEESLDPDIKWAEVTAAMEGYHPAFVVEGASRAMRYSLVRKARENGGKVVGTVLVTTQDLVSAATELRRQWDLHNGAKTHSEVPRLDRALTELVTSGVTTVIQEQLDERLLRDES
jgi:transitional endoplasmic reticulum ATPase